MRITKSDFIHWWNLPYTQEFRKLIAEDMDKLAHESMTTDHARDTVAKAEAVGAYKALETYANMTYAFFSGNQEEE